MRDASTEEPPLGATFAEVAASLAADERRAHSRRHADPGDNLAARAESRRRGNANFRANARQRRQGAS